MGTSIAQRLHAIRALGRFGEERAGTFFPVEGLLLGADDPIDRQFEAHLSRKERGSSGISALTDVYHDVIWSRIEASIFAVVRREGLRELPGPQIATAAVGDLNALSLADDDGGHAIVLDAHLHLLSTFAMHHCAALIGKAGPAGLSLRVSTDLTEGPDSVKQLPDFEDRAAEIARLVAHSVLDPRELWSDAERVADLIGSPVGRLANTATMGFNTFILAHEHGHMACGHHLLLRELRTSGASPEAVSEYRHAAELEADRFAGAVISHIVEDADSTVFPGANDAGSLALCKLLFMFGAGSFLPLLNARDALARSFTTRAAILELSHQFAATGAGGTRALAAAHRKKSATHPPALRRNRLLMEFLRHDGWDWAVRLGHGIYRRAADQTAEHLLFNMPNSAMESVSIPADWFERFHLSID